MATPELVKAVAVATQLTGAQFSDPAAEVLLARLARYDEKAVLAALDRCINELRRPLTLADVLERLDDGHLGPESAWALVARLGEDDTVVWTPEIAEVFQVARPLLHDKVASRLAFREVYSELLAEARGAARLPQWRLSLGWDQTRRARPVIDAVAAGRLPVSVAKAKLPHHEWPAEWSPERALPEATVPKSEVSNMVGTLSRQLASQARREKVLEEPAR